MIASNQCKSKRKFVKKITDWAKCVKKNVKNIFYLRINLYEIHFEFIELE